MIFNHVLGYAFFFKDFYIALISISSVISLRECWIPNLCKSVELFLHSRASLIFSNANTNVCYRHVANLELFVPDLAIR